MEQVQNTLPLKEVQERKIRLDALCLKDFKGLHVFDLVPKGENCTVYGTNGAGKTTLFDAWCWLWTGKDSLGQADFDLKTLTPDGKAVHGLSHKVSAAIRLPNQVSGDPWILTKSLSEIWTKKRGSPARVFSGHTTDHYLDGVPVKAGEYQQALADICDERAFWCLTDPLYFSDRLHWQQRREILMHLAGDVTDSYVLAGRDDLGELATMFAERSPDKWLLTLLSRRKNLGEELERLPVRIDEADRAGGKPTDPKVTRRNLEELEAEIAALRERKANLEAGGEAGEKKRRLVEVEAEISRIEAEARKAHDEAVRANDLEISKAAEEYGKIERERQELEELKERLNSEIQQIEGKIKQLRESWEGVNAWQMEFTSDSTCPACGQDLPAEKIEAARKEALAEFNEKKSRKLAEIQEEGKRQRATLDLKIAALQTAGDSMSELLKEEEMAAEKLRACGRTLRVLAETELDLDTVEYQNLCAERDRLLDFKPMKDADLNLIENDIGEKEAEASNLRGTLAEIEASAKARERVEELRAEQKRLAGEAEETERLLHLLEEFTRSKCGMVSERVNERFSACRFQLFEELINGGVREVCETTVNGVPWASLNHGHQVLAGIDIADVLGAHWGLRLPLWVDQAESIVDLPEVETQVIRLVVSGKDRVLRVETENTEEENERSNRTDQGHRGGRDL